MKGYLGAWKCLTSLKRNLWTGKTTKQK
jgi:hypothetical protein